ncbi:aspartic peptidase domain-containing protein [Paraphoma chrysanthemicola]|uniref:Aspartic peptidase domain-containing protein n=1 Tax=Paraphoma chrysanthemicola TaxID=798071 RepID=A0A8K0R3K5_9PLEO|nr:aspartic peptidase domain-containing protein [Paraphoma chrysanthemicola]
MVLRKKADVVPIPLVPKPIVLKTTGTFEGDDGKWSTFNINIAGDGAGKGQNYKVLISTSFPITLIPGQSEWCNDACAKSRGIPSINGQQSRGLDVSANSERWNLAGTYYLPKSDWWTKDLLFPSSNVTLDAAWGLTTVGLGEASKDSITLPNQYVAAYYFEDLFLGQLGLSVGAISPTGATKPTFFSALSALPEYVPSNSYGYTAGASYRNNNLGSPGNMVFGGYDKSRLVMLQSTSIGMPNKQNNTLIVGVQSIMYTPDPDVQQGVQSLTGTNEGFSAVIDSTHPYLVLPGRICDRFVEKFNLQYDNTTNLYTINSTAHDRNIQQNATVSFKIGAGAQDSAKFTTITLPYLAFYLEASFPIYTNATKYFPIRKSTSGYFVLGRTFLQEAYIIVDYERGNFTIAPAYWSEPMPSESLVTIYNTTYQPPTRQTDTGGGGLSAGAIAGIVIGIIAGFAILAGAAFLYWRRRRAAKEMAVQQEDKPNEIDTMVAGGEIKHRRVSELTGSEPAQSPQTKPIGYYGGDNKSVPPISEMSPESPPAELYSPPPEGFNGVDYFTSAQKPRRRGATRDSSGNNTPGTPVAELAGDEGRLFASGQQFDAVSPLQRPVNHNRSPSDTSLSTNIDEVLAGQDQEASKVSRKHSSRFVEHTGEHDSPEPSRAEMVVSPLENTRSDEAGATAEPTLTSNVERRPSHTRGLSDTTIASDSTAVSQPTPEELERWARSGDNAPQRPTSN